MNSKRYNKVFVSSLAAAISFGAFSEPAFAQTAQTVPSSSGVPPEAPSFLKQAGQKLFESAQKKVLHTMNEKIQNQAQTNTATTSAGSPAATTPGVPVPTGTPGVGVPPVAPPVTLVTTTTVPTTPVRQMAPVRSWISPQEKPIACLLCVHGLGLQSNSYEYFGKETSNRGIAVYAIDVRGFGTWMKANGKTKVNFDECLADIKQTLESIRAANPGLPVYILGESMGGAIALRAASMYPTLIDGLISSVPAGERFNQGKTSAKVFLNLLTGVNLANVGNDVLNQATKNAKLKSQWSGDPLARLNLSPQELIQFQDFMNFNHEAARKVTTMPVLFVQGTGDQLVKPEGTWELFNSIASKDKSFFAMPGEHLIFEEAQTQEAGPRDQNFRVIQSWLSAKFGRRNRGGYGQGGQRNPYAVPGYGPGYNGGGGAYGGPGAYNGPGGGSNYGASVNLDAQTQMIAQGNYSDAIADLERMRSERPGDPNVTRLLGKAYYLSGQPEKAGSLFRNAMRMGRGGGDQSRAFNSYLLEMGRNLLGGSRGGGGAGGMASPFAGWGYRPGADTTTSSTYSAGGGGAYPGQKGKVYAFFASWADQCKGLNDSIRQLSSAYGNRVDITPVNIEDPSSDTLIDQYKVGPIPTVVFVAPNGQVSQTIIGECNYQNLEQATRAIAP